MRFDPFIDSRPATHTHRYTQAQTNKPKDAPHSKTNCTPSRWCGRRTLQSRSATWIVCVAASPPSSCGTDGRAQAGAWTDQGATNTS